MTTARRRSPITRASADASSSDGSFRGTYWKMTLESKPGGDEDETSITRSAENRAPSEDEIAALRRIIADVLEP